LLEPGQIFASRYRVHRQIAEGGMGAIFEAVHTATERKVALKLLFPHIMSMASARSKFELEAKISARVNSPYIVEVLDAGFDEPTKSPYLVMELLDGQTVTAHVEERGPLSPDEALPLLEQVADALDAAHGYKENGVVKPIVHRDLKPDNLFLARERGTLRVKILDFGIAKVLGETSNMSQEVRGTPLYMAVEQITAGVLSPQTDVWALGLIAHYMLTGLSYWRSASNEAANMQSLFAEILTLPIEAPSVRLRELSSNVALTPGFDAWLLRCIDRTPTGRFASAGVAVEELARALGRTPRARAKPSTRPGGFARTEVAAAPPAALAPKMATIGTLPGVASEPRSLASALPLVARKPLMVGAGAAGALLLGGILWAAAGADDAPAAAVPAAAGAPSATPLPPPVMVAPVVVAPVAAAPAPPPAVSPAPPAAAVDATPPGSPAGAEGVTPKVAAPATAKKRSTTSRPTAAPRPVRRVEAAVALPRPKPAPPPPKKSGTEAYRMR
jgi:eukaryotic-like serine/threonine-protein kinase